MERGIVTMALGSPIYGKLAINFLVSIKHNSKIPVCIIYNKSAFKCLEDYLPMFDRRIELPNEKSGVAQAMDTKIRLYELTPFEKTLFLDADTLITPKFKVDTWFEELDGVPFTAYNTSIYKLNEKPYPYYKYWAEPKEIFKKFKQLTVRDTMPQINSSFLYFEKNPNVWALFHNAKIVSESKIRHEKFRGAFPDELAFNVGCALSGVMPHKERYMPLYLYILSEYMNKEYIIENFGAISMVGKEVPLKMVQIYNDFCEYYFYIAGLIQRFPFRGKDVPKKNRPTIGFYHICMINNFQGVVKEQIDLIVDSGLYDKSKVINVMCLGDVNNFRKLKRKYKSLEKLIWHHRPSISEYEFPTLKLMQETKGDYYAWYIHTKGVFNRDGDHWRHYMNHFNITNWKEAQDKLKEGYDIVGVKWMDENNRYPQHFSGNFFHIRSEYVRLLPPINTLNKQDRYQAEFWHGMAHPKKYSMSQIMIDHKSKPNFK